MLLHQKATDQKQKPQKIDMCHDLSVWNKRLKSHLLNESNNNNDNNNNNNNNKCLNFSLDKNTYLMLQDEKIKSSAKLQ